MSMRERKRVNRFLFIFSSSASSYGDCVCIRLPLTVSTPFSHTNTHPQTIIERLVCTNSDELSSRYKMNYIGEIDSRE